MSRVQRMTDFRSDEAPLLDSVEVPVGRRLALFETAAHFLDVSDYTRSTPTSPSAGRVYRRNLGWRPDEDDAWRFYVVMDDPADPKYQLHHPFLVVVLDDSL